jgi:hypothetical protein
MCLQWATVALRDANQSVPMDQRHAIACQKDARSDQANSRIKGLSWTIAAKKKAKVAKSAK